MTEKRDVSSYSLTDADWPGVISWLSDEWRLSVDLFGKRYHCQRAGLDSGGVERWVAPPGHKHRTRSALLAKCGALPNIGVACEGLPEDPSQALPGFRAAVESETERFHLNDWRREEYGRVIVRDGNMRLAVDAAGELYLLQWVPTKVGASGKPCHGWSNLCKSATAQGLGDKLGQVFDVNGSERPCPEIHRALEGAPRLAADGNWPVLPERPVTVGAFGAPRS